MNEKQIWKRIEERGQIKQKVIKPKPSDKLKDLVINSWLVLCSSF